MTQTYILREQLVVLVDILGQEGLLRSVTAFPATPEARTATAAVLEQTAGFVVELRQQFLEFFTQIGKPSEHYHQLSRDEQRRYRAVRRCTATTQVFSDLVVIAVPLDEDHDDLTAMFSVYAALLACSFVSLWSIGNRKALRGGMDAGWTVSLGNNELYGPGLAQAYHLEHRVACVPRVVVGEALRRKLSRVIQQSGESWEREKARGIARECLSLIALDADGQHYLDIAGEPMFRMSAAEPRVGAFIKPLFGAALEAARIEEWRLVSTGDNEGAASKWSWVHGYLRARAQLWQ